MKSIKHFIWDYDGTLLDTYPNITRYLQLALREFGVDVSRTELHEKMLVNLTYAIEHYSKLHNIPQLSERYKFYAANEENEDIKLFPHVVDVLRQIQKNGGHNYIFTNRGSSVFSFLEKYGIKDEFVEIVTSRHPSFALKPAPDVILYLMKKYGGTPNDTVMVGDRLCDLESGYSAGCKTIHLLTPSVPQYLNCDWEIENYKQMLDLLV